MPCSDPLAGVVTHLLLRMAAETKGSQQMGFEDQCLAAVFAVLQECWSL
jgi:hypothetical protein